MRSHFDVGKGLGHYRIVTAILGGGIDVEARALDRMNWMRNLIDMRTQAAEWITIESVVKI